MSAVTVLPVVGTMSASGTPWSLGGVWGQGGCRDGYTGYYPPTARGEAWTAKRAPEAPTRGWSGWSRARTSQRSPTHPLQASGLPGPASLVGSQNAASGPIRARLRSNLCKVSQNSEVSPKYVQKACHSPCFQNGSEISPLEILNIPFLAAFSHKELMVPF